ncbi:MAG: hypothetical protein IAE82_21650 [Opitutaceae bacterium]|nr:hypothetical protein [Opitutaceae bacterium]
MNTKQANKLASYTAVEAMLKALPEVEKQPGLPARLEQLSATIEEIKTLALTQTQPIRASMAQRDKLMEDMTDMTRQIAGFVASVATEHDLPSIRRTVTLGDTFRRLRRAHRLTVAERVLGAAREVLPQLAAMGVTAEILDVFEARIRAADEGVGYPRTTMVSKRSATVKLADLFRRVDTLLRDHIDALMFPVRKVDVKAYAAYRSARQIIDRRGSRSGSRGSKTPPGVAPVTATAVTEEPSMDKRVAA